MVTPSRRPFAWPALVVAWCCSCYGPPKLPTDDRIVVTTRVKPATSEMVCGGTHWNVDPIRLERLAESLRDKLSGRRGLAVTTNMRSADVIVEILGLYDPWGLADHGLCAVVYAARDPRVPLTSRYEQQFRAGRTRVLPGVPVGRYATGVETIIADNFIRIVSVRSRAVGEKGPLQPTTTAPLQGEYDLTIRLSPSCTASPFVAASSVYHASLYEHGDNLLLLLPDAPHDKVRGQIAGDRLSLFTADNVEFLFIVGASNSDSGALEWQGQVTGLVREDRIEAIVSGTVSFLRQKPLYTCKASDHRWTLTRRQ